jgi:hypothetical protein
MPRWPPPSCRRSGASTCGCVPRDGRPKRWLKRGATGLLYAGAGLTALQRIDDDKHWAPDVFLGLVNGFTVGEMLCHARE